ncbi:uncharacterized protein C8Q71DRAFT_744433, partial [Rhodofomes roseus]
MRPDIGGGWRDRDVGSRVTSAPRAAGGHRLYASRVPARSWHPRRMGRRRGGRRGHTSSGFYTRFGEAASSEKAHCGVLERPAELALSSIVLSGAFVQELRLKAQRHGVVVFCWYAGIWRRGTQEIYGLCMGPRRTKLVSRIREARVAQLCRVVVSPL